MIYNVKNTVGRGRPVRLFLDGKEITQATYLDRRRRVIRRWKTDERGCLVIDEAAGRIAEEVILYGHRQRVEVRPA